MQENKQTQQILGSDESGVKYIFNYAYVHILLNYVHEPCNFDVNILLHILFTHVYIHFAIFTYFLVHACIKLIYYYILVKCLTHTLLKTVPTIPNFIPSICCEVFTFINFCLRKQKKIEIKNICFEFSRSRTSFIEI